jgi:hypothetical protein
MCIHGDHIKKGCYWVSFTLEIQIKHDFDFDMQFIACICTFIYFNFRNVISILFQIMCQKGKKVQLIEIIYNI